MVKTYRYLTDGVRAKFKPLVEDYIKSLEDGDFDGVDKQSLELTNQGINPTQLEELLEELGYEFDGYDDSCPFDYEFYYRSETRAGYAKRLRVYGNASTFSISLCSEVND